jgi:biopolymer transport protein ExbB/TolQ
MLAVTTGLLWNVGCEKVGATEQQKENTASQDNLAAQNRAAEESVKAQAQMNDKVATAQGDFERARGDYRQLRQGDLDDVDAKIAGIDFRARQAASVTREHLEQSLAQVRLQRAAFAADVRAIDAVTASTWDDFKARVDDEYSSLKAALDKAS